MSLSSISELLVVPRTEHKQLDKSAKKIKLDIDLISIQFISNHRKTLVFDRFSSSKYTRYVLMVYTAQFKLRPPVVKLMKIVDFARFCVDMLTKTIDFLFGF